MKRETLLQKLIITFTIILTIVLVSLAWILSMWFRITYFAEKRTQFQQDGEYISKAIKTYNSEKSDIEFGKLQAIVDMSSVGTDADIIISDKLDYIYVYSTIEDNKAIEDKPQISEKDRKLLINGQSLEYINKRYTYIYPIIENDEFEGYVIMTTPLSIISKQLHRIYLIIWMSAFSSLKPECCKKPLEIIRLS